MTTPDQQHLIDRITRRLEADPRVESAWLIGSLGAGDGDAWSDVDILACAAEDSLAALVKDTRAQIDAIAPTLHVMTLYGRVLSAVASDWARFDISFAPPEALSARPPGGMRRLFARPGAAAPAGPEPKPRPPTGDEIEAVAREFLRVLGLFVVGVKRNDYILPQDGAGLLRSMLIDIMLAENGHSRTERGVKRLAQMLSDEQKRAIVALPPFASNREAAFAANKALAQAFIPRAKALAAQLGAQWPEAFEAGTRAYLEREIGFTF